MLTDFKTKHYKISPLITCNQSKIVGQIKSACSQYCLTEYAVHLPTVIKMTETVELNACKHHKFIQRWNGFSFKICYKLFHVAQALKVKKINKKLTQLITSQSSS